MLGLHRPGDVVGTTSGKCTLGDGRLATAAAAVLDFADLVGVMVEASGGIPGGVGGCRPEVMLFVPKVEKSKSSGSNELLPVFSMYALSSLRERNRLPVGPIMKTSYRPAEAPDFR